MNMQRLEKISSLFCGILGLAALLLLLILLLPSLHSLKVLHLEMPAVEMLLTYNGVLALITICVPIGAWLHLRKHMLAGCILIWTATAFLFFGIIVGTGGSSLLFLPGVASAIASSIAARQVQFERQLLARHQLPPHPDALNT